MNQYLQITLLALGTALATGLGALPLYWIRNAGKSWLGLGNSVAAGLMFGASIILIYEGWSKGLVGLAAGIVLGMLFMYLTDRLLPEEISIAGLGEKGARRALLLFLAMTIHSISEGVGIGVAFGSGAEVGLFIALAMAVHNIPEGLAISLAMVPKGSSVRKAALFSTLSSMPQPIMALPAFLFVEAFSPALPIGLGFAAGAMVWMVSKELLPEAIVDYASKTKVVIVTVLSFVAMLVFSWLAL